MDKLSKTKRSWNMGRIKSTNTSPEIIVRKLLHKMGFRFRLHRKDLPGKPDIVLSKYKTVIEVRGCYWHRHSGCSDTTTPKSNTEFWVKKFHENVKRDKLNLEKITELGWDVIVVWQCETKNLDLLATKLNKKLKSRLNHPTNKVRL